DGGARRRRRGRDGTRRRRPAAARGARRLPPRGAPLASARHGRPLPRPAAAPARAAYHANGCSHSVRRGCLPVTAGAERRQVRRSHDCCSRRLTSVDKHEALDVALGQIERQFGKGSVMKMSDRAAVSVGAVSTGSLALDLALGIGGLPRGRIVEIFGPESSGKTTLVYHVIAEAQKRGGICAFIDAEHAMDPTYAKRIGVDIDELLVSQ